MRHTFTIVFAAVMCLGYRPSSVEAQIRVGPDAIAGEHWIRLSADRSELAPSHGVTLEVCGRGELRFVDGRRALSVPESSEVFGLDSNRDVVSIVGGGAGFWTVRPVLALPEMECTTIRGGDTDEMASISSASWTRFWLRVDEDGEPTFIQPLQADDAQPGMSPQARAIDLALGRYADYGFSGAILVAQGDRIVHASGYGLADRERGFTVRAGTFFPLASLTKQFTAAAILKLADAGKLTADDTLSRFWPDLPEPVGSITLQQLMTHSSGLSEDIDGEPSTREGVIRALHSADISETRRERATYSNYGYVVLGCVIEQVTSLDYARAVQTLLFDPLGLKSVRILDVPRLSEDLVAVGYEGTFGSGRALEPRVVTPERRHLLGASGAVGSLPGLYRWLRALRSGDVISAPSVKQMFAPHVFNIGYGWFLYESSRDTRLFLHGGDTKGFQTYAGIYPDDDLIVLLAVNDSRGWRSPVYQTVVELAMGGAPPDLPPATVTLNRSTLQSLAGEYELNNKDRLDVQVTRNGLLVGAAGQAAVALISSPDPADRNRLIRHDEEAKTFVQALVAGERTAIDAALEPSGRPGNFFSVWDHLTSRHDGPVRDYTVLGTAPDRADRDITFVRFTFDDGEDTLRLVWRPHLDGWGTGGGLPQREFFPIGDGAFATFDIFSQETVRIRFDDRNGRPVMCFLGDASRPTASRVANVD